MEKKTRKAWTEEEEKAFAHLITTHSYNLREAFRLHAAQSGRTFYSVQKHYYTITRFNDNYIITIGETTMMIGKNRWTPRNVVQPIKIKRSQWVAVKKILGL